MSDTQQVDALVFWQNMALGLKDEWAKRGDEIDALRAELDQARNEIAALKAQGAGQGDDWGKTVDYLLTLAPEPEPPTPEPHDDWDEDDEDNPHYDTPGGY